MTETQRLFIAIDLTPDLRRGLAETRAALESHLPPGTIRWMQTDGIHLTLKFLGEIPSQRIVELHSVMDGAVAGRPPFRLEAGGLGCFPNTIRPRVLWVGVNAEPGLTDIQKKLETDLASRGFPREGRAFSPHLTLGRVRDGTPPSDLRRIGIVLESAPAGKVTEMEVAGLYLFRSILRPAGAEYSMLHRALLSG